MDESTTALDAHLRAAFDAGDFDRTATLTLESYGEEILSFLSARLRGDGDGNEAFSMFAEDLWAGLPRFAWRCSMRTWAYTLARNAANRYASAPHRRAQRNQPLSFSDPNSQWIEKARSITALHRRTEVKDRMVALRERLEPDDQMLLILRVDRDMAWRDIALAISGDIDLDEEGARREAARLRKCFERLKSELKKMAEDEGLLPRS